MLQISLGLKRKKAKCSGTPLSLALEGRGRQISRVSGQPGLCSELQDSQDSVERHCQERKERKGEKEGRREGRGRKERKDEEKERKKESKRERV